MTINPINVFDLKKENKFFLNKFIKSFKNSVTNSNFILSKKMFMFENNFAKYIGTNNVVSVGNGMNALEIILKSLDFEYGSEVIVPGHTFIATWLAVQNNNLKVIPVDSDLSSYNIDLNLIKNKISNKTKAIIVTHMYGNPVNILKLKKIINNDSIIIIEDAAQAHGSSINNIKVGALGDYAAFSFYPTKNLGALGDGGAISFGKSKYKKKIKSIRNYGSLEKHKYFNFGTNSRLDSIQADFLNIKLRYLDKFIKKKNKIASYYLKNIKNTKITLPIIEENITHSFHLFVIRTKQRAKLVKYLELQNIFPLIHYPIACHDQKIFKKNNFELPNSRLLSKQALSIPCHAFINLKEAEFIVKVLNEY
jgi:dTDP-4-amino-4,6-dideoxygalactose transaminase